VSMYFQFRLKPLLILAAFLCLAGLWFPPCIPAAFAEGSTLYAVEDQHFSVEIAEDFQVYYMWQSQGEVLRAVRDVLMSSYPARISAKVFPMEGRDLTTFAAFYREVLGKERAFKPAGEGTTSLMGQTVPWLEYTTGFSAIGMTGSNQLADLVLRGRSVMVEHNGKAYVFELTALDKDFAGEVHCLDDMLKTLRFTD